MNTHNTHPRLAAARKGRALFTPNIFSSPFDNCIYINRNIKNWYERALYNMGTSLKTNPLRLNLTPREMEVCTYFFLDRKSHDEIAQWLNLSVQTVRNHIFNALAKEPALRILRKKPRRPKIIQMSQIQNPRDLEHAPFNPDEI